MSNLAHRLHAIVEGVTPSLYARMIPGAGTLPEQKRPPASVRSDYDHKTARSIVAVPGSRKNARRSWAFYLLPRPRTADRFALYQLVVSDLAVLCSACLLSSLLPAGWAVPWMIVPAYAVMVTLFAYSEGAYSEQQTLREQIPALVRSGTFAMVLVLVVEWTDIQPKAGALALINSVAGLIAWRRLVDWSHQHSEQAQHNILIVGATAAGRAIARALRNDSQHGHAVRGFVDDNAPLSAEVLGRTEDLDWLARAEFVDEVIVALPNRDSVAREAAQIAYRNHLDIRAVPDLPVGVWPDACVDRIGEVPVVTLHRETIPSLELFLKRMLDIAGALTGIVIASPIFVVVALAIRLESPGPVFYSAPRTGAKGRRFRCYKFRSMVADADLQKDSLRDRNQREGPIFKIKNDPRITRVGRFIRRYSLDELPQLWNVLRGDMSLVGPRPHPVDEVNHYELHHFRRLDVRPGLTGLWQVTARKNPSFDLNMHLDLTYIENWTLQLDLRILLRTVRVLFAPEGM